MDFNLSDELLMLKETVRRFVDEELIPLEAKYRPEADAMPEELLRPLQQKAKSIGLWLLDVPKEYGGAELDLLTRCVIAEEVGRTVVIPYRLNEVFGPEVRPPLFYCNEEQKERYLHPVLKGEKRMCFALTEPDAGSDPAGMQTSAVRDGDDFVINGTKRFISGAGYSDFAQVMALTDPEKRARGGITSFLVDLDTPGVNLTRQQPTMMGDAPWEIVFDNVRIPASRVLGEVGAGFSLAQEWLTDGRVRCHGAQSIGMAQRALDMMMDYARDRVTFGKPLSQRQAVQFMIANSAMELHAARLMVYECAWRHDRNENVRDTSYMVKITCTEMASQVVDRAIQVFGGMGLTKELPLEWMYRQLRSIRITEGATEVLRWRLAQNLMKKRSRH
ncbi:MAG: acyl-CoA dehydrogenase family protein [Acidobacteria bacterium]|nr:acyl-CoA dehydrogenase family protein [Acidobacteriota bacterium]